MFGKLVLWITGLIFVGYGIACAFAPDMPAQYIGYTMTNADARIEVIAMYGGLQTGFGAFCILAAQREGLRDAGLWLVLLVIGGLASTRLIGFALIEGPVTVYTHGALVFEITTAIATAVALKLRPGVPAA